MIEAIKRWPWYAAVLAVYPMLHLAVTNPGQVGAGDALPVVAVGIAAASVLVALLRPVMGTWTAAGVGATWVALLFYLYAPVNEWWMDWVRAALEQRAADPTWYNAHPQLLHSAAWALIALAGLARLRLYAPRIPAKVTIVLNVFALLLVALVSIQAVTLLGSSRGSESEPATPPSSPTAAATAGPDIYFILLDGYARGDILEKYYGYDNAPFLDGLRSRGFQVSDASRSNFYWTFLSVGSALNLDYVQKLVDDRLDPVHPGDRVAEAP